MKVNISTASPTKKARFHLPTTHLTTLGLGDFRPINILPLIQGDRVHCNFSQVSQTQPTAVQTFGAFKIKTYAFWVPFKTIWRGYEHWKEQTPDASVSSSPLNFDMMSLLEGLLGASLEGSSDYVEVVGHFEQNMLVGSPATPSFTYLFERAYTTSVDVIPETSIDNFDFVVIRNMTYVNSSSLVAEGLCLNLTPKGRRLHNILLGLGYNIPHRISLYKPNGTSAPISYEDLPKHILNKKLSALPLLAFGRFLYDYVYPSQYVQQQGFGYLFESDLPSEDVYSWISKLFDLVFVPYEQDFFNSLWLLPNQKGIGEGQSGSLVNGIVTSDVSAAYGVYSGTQSVGSNGQAAFALSVDGSNDNAASQVSLTAQSLRWLQAVSDFVVRNNIGGTRFHEYMKSHFGYVTSEQDSHRSYFIKSWQDVVNFSPVTAQTGSDSQLLGERAANGSSRGGGALRFEAKEEGFLMFASMVVPSTAYHQGLMPWCEALTSRYQLYTPEIDSVGFEPIPRGRVFSSYERGADLDKVDVETLDNAFGFGHRYADMYKVSKDFLTGDFALPSRKDTGAYHTFRDVLYNRTNLALDAKFMEADNQYDRIYAVNPTDEEGSSLYDKIETLFLFDLTKYSDMLSISASLPIFNKSGRDVELDYGGTQLN